MSRYSDGIWDGRSGFDSRNCNIFLFFIASRPALGPTQPSIQWLPGPDHSPLSSAEVKQCLHSPTSSWRDAYLIKRSLLFVVSWNCQKKIFSGFRRYSRALVSRLRHTQTLVPGWSIYFAYSIMLTTRILALSPHYCFNHSDGNLPYLPSLSRDLALVQI
jgi:hypothetical protein